MRDVLYGMATQKNWQKTLTDNGVTTPSIQLNWNTILQGRKDPISGEDKLKPVRGVLHGRRMMWGVFAKADIKKGEVLMGWGGVTVYKNDLRDKKVRNYNRFVNHIDMYTIESVDEYGTPIMICPKLNRDGFPDEKTGPWAILVNEPGKDYVNEYIDEKLTTGIPNPRNRANSVHYFYDDRLIVVAARDIKRGEEITFRYNAQILGQAEGTQYAASYGYSPGGYPANDPKNLRQQIRLVNPPIEWTDAQHKIKKLSDMTYKEIFLLFTNDTNIDPDLDFELMQLLYDADGKVYEDIRKDRAFLLEYEQQHVHIPGIPDTIPRVRSRAHWHPALVGLRKREKENSMSSGDEWILYTTESREISTFYELQDVVAGAPRMSTRFHLEKVEKVPSRLTTEHPTPLYRYLLHAFWRRLRWYILDKNDVSYGNDKLISDILRAHDDSAWLNSILEEADTQQWEIWRDFIVSLLKTDEPGDVERLALVQTAQDSPVTRRRRLLV